MISFGVARLNMIKQQLRPHAVLNDRLLGIIDNTPRDYFVPEKYKSVAYADVLIPIGHEQTMMLPQDEGALLQALHINSGEKVLEIGTGTGYLTALLSQLSKSVVSIDIFPDFTTQAKYKLAALNHSNVTIITTDVALGLGHKDMFDVVVITASLPYLPHHFLEHVNVGGRLFAIVGEEPIMTARLYTHKAVGKWDTQDLFETNIKPLLNLPKADGFSF